MTTYEDWLQFVFDRPTTSPEWFWGLDETLSLKPDETVELIQKTFSGCGKDLARFTDDQVGLGFNYILSGSCSDLMYCLKNDAVGFEKRMGAISSIKTLYSDCFTPRCARALGHRSEADASRRLNYVCYMLWDISPIVYWEDHPRRKEIYALVIDVLKEALRSPNIACVESALHGLGHIQHFAPEHVKEVVGTFLMSETLDERLIKYAQSALVGNVQ